MCPTRPWPRPSQRWRSELAARSSHLPYTTPPCGLRLAPCSLPASSGLRSCVARVRRECLRRSPSKRHGSVFPPLFTLPQHLILHHTPPPLSVLFCLICYLVNSICYLVICTSKPLMARVAHLMGQPPPALNYVHMPVPRAELAKLKKKDSSEVKLKLIDPLSPLTESSFNPNTLLVIAVDPSNGHFLFAFGRRNLEGKTQQGYWDQWLVWCSVLRDATRTVAESEPVSTQPVVLYSRRAFLSWMQNADEAPSCLPPS